VVEAIMSRVGKWPARAEFVKHTGFLIIL